jgi:hypothetical protein
MTVHTWVVRNVGGSECGVRAHNERMARIRRLADLLNAGRRRDLSLDDMVEELPASAVHSSVCACRMGEGETGASAAGDLYAGA